MKRSLALGVLLLVACGKESTKSITSAALGPKYEKLSKSFEFLSGAGLGQLELIPTGMPSLSLKLAADDPLLSPLNASLFDRIDVKKDLDRIVSAPTKPIFDRLKSLDWKKATGGLALRDEEDEFGLLGGSEFSVELPKADQAPSHLTLKADGESVTLWLKVFWPAPEDKVEKGLEFGISVKEDGKPRIALLYDATRLAQLSGLAAEDCAGNKVQLLLDIDVAPKMRVDLGECAGGEIVTKSLWVQQAADGYRLAGRITTDVSLLFQLATDLQAAPHLVGDIALGQQAEITSLAGYMTDNGLGSFIDRYVSQTFWRPAEEASATNIAPMFCGLDELSPDKLKAACGATVEKGVLKPLLTDLRDDLPAEVQTGVDGLLKVLNLGNPVSLASTLSLGNVPEELAPLETALRQFQAELETDANYKAGGFVPEIILTKELPKALF